MNRHFSHGMHVRSVEAGSPKGVILYIHGLGESGLLLETLMSHPLLKDYSHLAADMPGYGKSPWPEAPLGISEQSDLLADWLSLLDIPEVTVLGHSMGGVIGTLLCERRPEMVRSFINVEGNISDEDCTFSRNINAYSLKDFLRYGFDTFCAEICERGRADKALKYYHASLLMCDPRTIHKNSRELVHMSCTGDLSRRLGALPIPSCYVWGSPGGTQECSLNLLRKENVPLVEISNAGHWPFIDQPDEFAERVLAILSSSYN